MQGKVGLYAAEASLMTSLLISVVLHLPEHTPRIYSDIVDSFWQRSWVQEGSLPYVNSSFEYPPLSGLLVYVSKSAGVNLTGYYVVISALSLLAGGVVAWSSWSIARKLGRELNPLFFVMPSFLVYGIYNFDLFNVMFVLLSVQAYLAGRNGVSALFLGLAIDTKLVGLVLLPIFLLDLRGRRKRIGFILACGAAVAALALPFALANFESFYQGYAFLANWGLEDAWYVWIFQDPSTWWSAKLFGLILGLSLLSMVYASKGGLVERSALAVSAYLLSTYIYAPQFNILLLPLVAVLDLRSPFLYLWDGFNALIILTWFDQPNPTHAGTLPQLFSLLRGAALVGLALTAARSGGVSLPAAAKRLTAKTLMRLSPSDSRWRTGKLQLS